MKTQIIIQVFDETNSFTTGGGIVLSSPRLDELNKRVLFGIDDQLTKEITVQAIVAELMANPANVMTEVCKDFANNLMQYVPEIKTPEQE
jgi:hypothetical protein